MSKRRIEALLTLRRLEERQLNQLSRQLNAVQAAQAQALQDIDTLQKRSEIEAQSRDVEALPYIGKFLAALRKEQGRAQQVSHHLERQIEGLRSEVMQHFGAERSYDRLAQTTLEALRKERERKAESAMEDMTLSRFRHA